MLKRIYIDNYKCCVNFELAVDKMNLLLGPNGVGKSTVFDALGKIRWLVAFGVTTDKIFFGSDLTRWQTRSSQRFELEIEDPAGVYRYELVIKFSGADQSQVESERLWLNHGLLIQQNNGQVDLYRDDFSPDTSYPLNTSQSAIALLPERPQNERVTNFKEYLRRIFIVQVNPRSMKSVSERDEAYLSYEASNFVSWYRYLSQNQGLAFDITKELQEIFDDFRYFQFEELGEHHRGLKAFFALDDSSRKALEYKFHELSDGQRVLIVLYTLLHYVQSLNCLLCIDEPENYLALAEIQPWLIKLWDWCHEGPFQTLLISHHPEFIDYLAASQGIWFDRQNNAPVRVKRIVDQGEEGMPISELVARGWIHG